MAGPTDLKAQKRKRLASPVTNTDAEPVITPGDLRQRVAAIYLSYSNLISAAAAATGQGGLPLSSANATEGAPHASRVKEEDFLALLDAGTGPMGVGTQRLACRLVPRFLHHFPHHCAAAAALLLGVLECGSSKGGTEQASLPLTSPSGAVPDAAAAAAAAAALASSARRDALAGLRQVLQAAVGAGGTELVVPVVLKVVTFALRLLHSTSSSLAAATTSTVNNSHRALPSQPQVPGSKLHTDSSTRPSSVHCTANGTAADGGTTDVAAAELATVQALLDLSFRLFPRVVLAVCIQALQACGASSSGRGAGGSSSSSKGGDAALVHGGALAFVRQHLLRPGGGTDPSVAADQHPAVDGSRRGLGSSASMERATAASTSGVNGSVGGDRLSDGQAATVGSKEGDGPVKMEVDGGGGAEAQRPASGRLQGSGGSIGSGGDVGSSGGGPPLLAEVLAELPESRLWLFRALTLLLKDKKAMRPSSEATKMAQEMLVIVKTLAGPSAMMAAEPCPANVPPHLRHVKAEPPDAAAAGLSTLLSSSGATAATAAAAAAAATSGEAAAAAGILPPPPLPSSVKSEGGGMATAAPLLVGGQDAAGMLSTVATAGSRESGDLRPLVIPPSLADARHSWGQQGAAPRPGGSTVVPSGTVPERGGDVCRAEPCLWLSNVPPGVSDASVLAECSRYSRPEFCVCSGSSSSSSSRGCEPGEAYVVFSSVRDAAVCLESLACSCPFGGTAPLGVAFCSTTAVRDGAVQLPPPSQYVWVAGGRLSPEHVVRSMQEAGLRPPAQILRVQGAAQGLLLDMGGAGGHVPQVIACLQGRLATSASHPPPHSVPPTSSHPGAVPGFSPAHTNHNGAHQQSLLPGSSSVSDTAAGRGGIGGTSGGSNSHVPPGVVPPPPLSSLGTGGGEDQQTRTLWIGQIHDSVSDADLLSSCKRHGDVVGYRFLRHNHCAFVDFATAAAAAQARAHLNGARFGPSAIRVEWKMDDGRGGGGGRPGAAPPTPSHRPLYNSNAHHAPVNGATVAGPSPSTAAAPGGVGSSGVHLGSQFPPPPPATGAMASNGGVGGMPQAVVGGTAFGLQPPPPPVPPPVPPPPGGATHRRVSGFATSANDWQQQQQHGAGGGSVFGGISRPLPPPPPALAAAAFPHPPPPSLHPHHPPVPPPLPSPPPDHLSGGVPPHVPPPGPPSFGSAVPMTSSDASVSYRSAQHPPHMVSISDLTVPPPPVPPPSAVPPPVLPAMSASHVPPHLLAATAGGSMAGNNTGGTAGGTAASWSVVLAKSGAVVCTLYCIDNVSHQPCTADQRDAAGWPATLDVNLRAEVQLVQQTYHATPVPLRAVRRLVPTAGGEAALAGFLAYLSGKSRAGVIKVPPAGERGPRTLYLVPPSESVCRSLGVLWEPKSLVVAVEVPTPTLAGR